MKNIRYTVGHAYGYSTVYMEYDQDPREGRNGCGSTGQRTIISGLTKKLADNIAGALTDAYRLGKEILE
jgi:hypothetical protein